MQVQPPLRRTTLRPESQPVSVSLAWFRGKHTLVHRSYEQYQTAIAAAHALGALAVESQQVVHGRDPGHGGLMVQG